MPPYSPAFLTVLALATQSFAAPLETTVSLNAAASQVDSMLSYGTDYSEPTSTGSAAFTLETSMSPVAPITTSIFPTSIPSTLIVVEPSSSSAKISSKVTTNTKPAGTAVTTSKKPSGTSINTKGAAVSTSSAPEPSTSTTATTVTRKTYKGDGSAADGWPTIDQWASFDQIWANNVNVMGQYTCQLDGKTPTTDAEKDEIKSAIGTVASSTGVDERYILATILQESGGCVRVNDTVSPGAQIRNPGLMQDHNGTHSCASTPAPCPSSEIQGMIMDGTNGTLSSPGGGDGLVQTMAQAAKLGAPAKSAQQVYWAARIYNSGTYVVGKALEDPSLGATADYSDEIANRLMGAVF